MSIVGIGPGDASLMSKDACRAISECDCLIGYATYIRLLGRKARGKEVISYGMTEETDRAAMAIKKALEGKVVCVVSSGDPGIYGMAGVVLESLRDGDAHRIDINIIPGIISATACAAILGAPIMNDFAAISLSDLLTDWAEIEKRIDRAASSDFVIILYNPKSTRRAEPLRMAWDIIKRHRPPMTPVGIVKNAYRNGQDARIVNLEDAPKIKDIDMATSIIIGNAKTYVKNGYMITPRGYNETSHKPDFKLREVPYDIA